MERSAKSSKSFPLSTGIHQHFLGNVHIRKGTDVALYPGTQGRAPMRRDNKQDRLT